VAAAVVAVVARVPLGVDRAAAVVAAAVVPVALRKRF
jgi:hypothetical protein